MEIKMQIFLCEGLKIGVKTHIPTIIQVIDMYKYLADYLVPWQLYSNSIITVYDSKTQPIQ